MRVLVHLGEPFWRTAGARQIQVALANGATVADAFDVLTKRYPALMGEFGNAEAKPALFVNDEAAGLERLLVEGANLHVVWLASGGQ